MFFEVKNLQTNKSKQHLSHFSDSFDSYYSEMIRAEMISGFTPTWYPQRRGVGQHVPGGYGHLVQNCKVKGFRCSRRRLPPQTVLKVSARVEKSVPHYRGDNEFSILAGGTFTFKTVSSNQSIGLHPSRLSEKSRRELKSLYPTTGATTNSQSSQGVLLLLRQSPPINQ